MLFAKPTTDTHLKMRALYLPDKAPAELPSKVARMLPFWIEKEKGAKPKAIHFVSEFHEAWLFLIEMENGFLHAQIGGQMIEGSLVVTQRDLIEMEFHEELDLHFCRLTAGDDPLLILWIPDDNQAMMGKFTDGGFNKLVTQPV